MNKLMDALDALARKSGGGVIPSKTLAGQGIKGVALFLEDGRVALIGNPPATGSAGGPPLFSKGGFEESSQEDPLLKGAGSAEGADWGIPSQGGEAL